MFLLTAQIELMTQEVKLIVQIQLIMMSLEKKEKNVVNYMVWVNINKAVCQGEVIRIPYSDPESEENFLRKEWINKMNKSYWLKMFQFITIRK